MLGAWAKMKRITRLIFQRDFAAAKLRVLLSALVLGRTQKYSFIARKNVTKT